MAKKKKKVATKNTARRKTPPSNGAATQATAGTIVLDHVDGETRVDASVVRMAAIPLQKTHRLSTKRGLIEPTPEFAIELAATLGVIYGPMTPTVALHAWSAAADYFVSIQKKTKR